MRLLSLLARSSAWRFGILLSLLWLDACAGGHKGGQPAVPAPVASASEPIVAPQRYYPPPGPPEDPWGPYIREASTRYDVPERWVRAVMHQESDGEQQAISPVGAMGLMQVMPETYDELRERYKLGDDPFDPHNNVLAGVAYLREMYDRFGAPGFLAAYNAGPARVDEYLAGDSHLPEETVDYMAAITPHLGTEVAFSGPFARYASLHPGRAVAHAATIASLASGCDLNAAYNPKHPCPTLERAAVAPAPSQAIQVASANYCDPDAAYNPAHPCRYASSVTTAALQPPAAAKTGKPGGPATASKNGKPVAPSAGGEWAIQIGAFTNPKLAKAVVEGAQSQAPGALRTASFSFPPITSSTGTLLYRARLIHLSANDAANACQTLNKRQLPCIVVQPGAS